MVLMGPANGWNQTENQLETVLRIYKIPLLLGLLSIFLIVIASVALFRSSLPTDTIEFSQSTTATASGIAHQTKIKADIEGAVQNPGMYELDKGSRINDLLLAAGGLTGDVDIHLVEKNINRAAILVDGAKLYIPRLNESGTSYNYESLSRPEDASYNNSSINRLGETTININSASQIQLESLPGIGPVTATKIIAGRPYQTLQELVVKKAVGTTVFEKIKEFISL